MFWPLFKCTHKQIQPCKLQLTKGLVPQCQPVCTNILAALLLPFSVTAHLPIQDVCLMMMTRHILELPRHTLGPVINHFYGHQMFTIGPKCAWPAAIHLFSRKRKRWILLGQRVKKKRRRTLSRFNAFPKTKVWLWVKEGGGASKFCWPSLYK